MILGIDQSLTATGLCLTTDTLEITSIKTVDSKDMSNLLRVETVVNNITALIHLAGFATPLTVVREGYAFQARTNTAFQLGELGGCINHAIYQYIKNGNPMRVLILPPSTVKLMTLGDGSIKKDSAYLMKVFKTTGKEFEDDNQADAFLLCKSAFMLYSIVDNTDCTQMIKELTIKQTIGLVPPSVRKKNKLTEAKVKKLTATDLQSMVRQAVATVYGFNI